MNSLGHFILSRFFRFVSCHFRVVFALKRKRKSPFLRNQKNENETDSVFDTPATLDFTDVKKKCTHQLLLEIRLMAFNLFKNGKRTGNFFE
jgi:hypothetical protein